MSFDVVHSLIVSSVSLGLMVVVYYLARRQKISFRYTVGWLMLLVVGLFSGALVPLIGPLAEALRLAPISILVGVAVCVLLAICVQLTVSISGLQSQVRLLTERIALNEVSTGSKSGNRSE